MRYCRLSATFMAAAYYGHLFASPGQPATRTVVGLDTTLSEVDPARIMTEGEGAGGAAQSAGGEGGCGGAGASNLLQRVKLASHERAELR